MPLADAPSSKFHQSSYEKVFHDRKIRQFRQWFQQWWTRATAPQRRKAEREVLQTIFDDLYTNRRGIYKLNFFRGIFFGLGSILGGTLVLAIAIWVLTWFVNFPLIGEWIEKIISNLPSR